MIETIDERIALPVGEIALTRPRDSEALLTEEGFEREEFLPYWAELWSSSIALAHDLARRSLRCARVLELGCGLGLPSIAATLAGGRVLATDWSPDAVRAAGDNARRNSVELETALVDWAHPDELIRCAPFDLALAADVLYETGSVAALLALLPRIAPEAWLADPGRPAATAFVDEARRRGWGVETTLRGVVQIHRLQLG